jgi:hypothetical protein
MTYQTSEPVREIPITLSGRAWGGLVKAVQDGDISLDPPYQRGHVWTYEKRIKLIFSIIQGTVPAALIINERPREAWFDAAGDRLPTDVVIDGKQRITAVRMFMEGELAVPESWFPRDDVTAVQPTADGAYTRYQWLSEPARRFFARKAAPVSETHIPTIAEEAEVYLRVNGAGTPQAAEDIARATRVAGEGA